MPKKRRKNRNKHIIVVKDGIVDIVKTKHPEPSKDNDLEKKKFVVKKEDKSKDMKLLDCHNTNKCNDNINIYDADIESDYEKMLTNEELLIYMNESLINKAYEINQKNLQEYENMEYDFKSNFARDFYSLPESRQKEWNERQKKYNEKKKDSTKKEESEHLSDSDYWYDDESF